MTVKRNKWLRSKALGEKVILISPEMNCDSDCAGFFSLHILN